MLTELHRFRVVVEVSIYNSLRKAGRVTHRNSSTSKSKAIPGQVLRVPGAWGYQTSRQSTCKRDKIVSPTHRPFLLPHRKYSWFLFLLEVESTPDPKCGRKDYVNKNSNETTGNRTRDLPACSAVRQPAAPLCTPLRRSSSFSLRYGMFICISWRVRVFLVLHVFLEHDLFHEGWQSLFLEQRLAAQFYLCNWSSVSCISLASAQLCTV
jgi:hypothetical protein